MLTVHLKSASGLKAYDMGGSSDPFVTCKVGDKSRTSHVERSTLNPKWDEKLHFTGTLQEMIPHGCLLSLYDHDRNTTNESLGEFEVDLEALAHHDVLEFREELPTQGRMEFLIRWEKTGAASFEEGKLFVHLQTAKGLKAMDRRAFLPARSRPPAHAHLPLSHFSPHRRGHAHRPPRATAPAAPAAHTTRATPPPLRLTATSDPYIELTHASDGRKKRRSKTVEKNLNPRWDEHFEWSGVKRDVLAQPLLLKAFDRDSISADDPLGHATIDLGLLHRVGQYDFDVKLSTQGIAAAGGVGGRGRRRRRRRRRRGVGAGGCRAADGRARGRRRGGPGRRRRAAAGGGWCAPPRRGVAGGGAPRPVAAAAGGGGAGMSREERLIQRQRELLGRVPQGRPLSSGAQPAGGRPPPVSTGSTPASTPAAGARPRARVGGGERKNQSEPRVGGGFVRVNLIATPALPLMALRALEAVTVPSYSAISPPTDPLRRLHDEERVVRPRPLRAHVEGARRRKAAGVVEVRADHLAVLQVGLLQPHHHRLRLEAAVALRQYELSTGFEHAVDFLEDLERFDQVVDADDARGGVEGVVVVRQRRVDVEVLRLKVGELGLRSSSPCTMPVAAIRDIFCGKSAG